MNSQIISKFESLQKIPSDINEHLITLKKYSEECEVIVEMGVRKIVSTWAFLSASPKKLISLDLHHPKIFGGNLDEVIEAVKGTSIDFQFIEADSLKYKCEPCDLLFIDTWHEYTQLKKELFRHHQSAKKYIILHDTVSFGFVDEDAYSNQSKEETNLPTGLIPAIDEFLFHNKEWVLWERKVNNNGLTILKRISPTF